MPPPPVWPTTKPLSEDYLAAIGRVVTSWSLVEARLQDIIAGQIQANIPHSYAVTENLGSSSLISTARALAGNFGETDAEVDDYVELLNHVDRLRAERNQAVHGLWGTDAPEGFAECQTVRIQRSTMIVTWMATCADVHDLADEISETALELIAIGRDLGFLRA